MAVKISCIRGLGEIALRVHDLDRMQSFYEQVVGLQLMKRFPASAFFRIAEGVGGHTQILALFDRGDRGSIEDEKPPTTLDHLAFAVVREDLADEKRRIEQLGVPMETAEHAWVQWRSFYVNDPEGNKVEWVCYDASVTDET